MHQMQHSGEPPGGDRLGLVSRGYVLVYRPGYSNFCPGCGAGHWHVGRHTAECARCMTALPIAALVAGTPDPRTERTGWRAFLPAI